jgi:glucokinase
MANGGARVPRSRNRSPSRAHPPVLDLSPSTRAVLDALRGGARSATELERLTRLSLLTVRRHVDALATRGLVAPAGLGRSNGGRQPRLFTLVADSRLALAMHLQFPGAKVATVGLDGTVMATRYVPADGRDDPLVVLSRLASVAERLTRHAHDGRLIGVGVALPGYADLTRGVSMRIGRAPTWRDVPVSDVLSRRLGLTTLLVHDTAAMALAESEAGAARGERHFAFVLAEEGVSAGLFLDGAIYQGAFGNAGLIGHTTVRPGGRRCYCGSAGCLEAYASARALAARPAELAPRIAKRPVSSRAVVRRALAGEEPFRTVLDEALELLGVAIANLAKVLEIHTIFVGGYPAGIPEPARARLLDTARMHLQPPLRARFDLRYSQVREAGLVGAAIPVIRRFLGAPTAAP